MGSGKLIGFTDNYKDNSTDAGFEFTFFCSNCNEGYKTRFKASKTYKKKGFLKGLGKMAGAAGSFTGYSSAGSGMELGSDAVGGQYEGMTPAWHKEHEAAYEEAQNEIKGNFTRCPKCTKWVCENCWNDESGLCVADAPRVSTEVAAARAEKMAADIRAKAASTQVFSGEIEAKQTICPKCGKPAGEGKFCNSCGTPLDLNKCSKCGAQNPPGTGFCGECGTKLG
ncbi:MAG: zinc ribbon domain-containing protein [Candidatus Thermoplasmatota archaeon]|nr:zinc ribbon domain-containing protein [Euryarchaeota archaeon]MBU4032015.1 zinc ribbon domain-containing protein [Candidatus Thermoplasmatota archaeon]MBU4071793.1 zinc ribbon domain-containing protein [Candidatus Thermoplasmatota archaeon]MBU4143896.1 zinc ribbon domain-containing protein [Candidatus Thermoplasmatota archaeon]MBU4592495.1 zinc ribbon domain-containing protein [Candidatus Thermoplasmatota archaeon]